MIASTASPESRRLLGRSERKGNTTSSVGSESVGSEAAFPWHLSVLGSEFEGSRLVDLAFAVLRLTIVVSATFLLQEVGCGRESDTRRNVDFIRCPIEHDRYSIVTYDRKVWFP
jgi:hypothetical protein